MWHKVAYLGCMDGVSSTIIVIKESLYNIKASHYVEEYIN